MRFGTRIPLIFDPAARDPYHQTYVLCEAAEQAGFDFVSLTHHAFSPECETSAPFVTLAAIAARTTTLKLATIIYILPLYHPAAVAEQVASLDRISNGRVILGIGVGYRDYEFKGHGADFRHRGARADEALSAIRHAWATGRFNHQGVHFQIPDLPAVPMPVQWPHPPMWIGGWSDAALKRAARCDGWISDNMMSLQEEAEIAQRYRALCAEAGREPLVCVTRNAWCGATREDVMADWYDSVVAFYRGYLDAGLEVADASGEYQRLKAGERVPLSELAHDRALAGTPADCIAQLQRWRDMAGCDAMLLLLNENAGFDKMQATIKRFGREVFPALG